MNRLGVALQVGHLRMTGLPLNSVQRIPPAILAFVGDQLDQPAPQLASIRALYGRRRTLFEHQTVAQAILGLRTIPEHGERALVAFLRRSAGEHFMLDALTGAARAWLCEHSYLQLTARRLRRLTVAAHRHHEAGIAAQVDTLVAASLRDAWLDALLEITDVGKTRMEWLREGLASKKPMGVANQFAKIAFLKEQGAAALDVGIPLALLQRLARPMPYRKPAALARMRPARRTLEIACFLRLQLLRATDDGLDVLDHRVADLWRQARTRVEAGYAGDLRRYHRLVADLGALAADAAVSADALRAAMLALLAPFQTRAKKSKAAAIREQLATEASALTALLGAVSIVGVEIAADHPLAAALTTLTAATADGGRELPADTASPFGPTWRRLIDQPDRAASLNAFRAATLLLVKRALRNGQASVAHSLAHRALEDRLIPPDRWRKERGRLIRDLSVTAKPESAIRKLEAGLATSLAALDAVVVAGERRVEDDRLIVPRPKAVEEDEVLRRARKALFDAVGRAQLPNVLVEVDAATRFSWTLLGRQPRSEGELVVLYAALIALGSDLSAADMVRMIPGVSADSVGQMMTRLEGDGRLRAANTAVLERFRALPITKSWGDGVGASADMMSLDATRHLWSARREPRRRTHVVGTYTHVLDQWPIVHDAPIILNKRQAGAAIEGALRQEQVELERLAVDTHGFTYFAMALARLVGFDLCPRLAHLGDRKLHLPRGFESPAALSSIVRATVMVRAITQGWDPLLRIAASVKTGWCSATYILERFGSAARGDVAFQAGDALGRLLTTSYLCDYLVDPAYRGVILDLLNQGEAVHVLQRAIHAGPVTAKRGRTPEQLAAISGALTLLTNVVMTWNAGRMDAIVRASPDAYPRAHVERMAPIAHAHINMRGQLTFNIAHHRAALLGDTAATAAVRAASR